MKTRYLAATGADPKKIAGILDDAEYLIALLMREEVDPSRVLRVLEDMGRKHPELRGLAVEYDDAESVANRRSLIASDSAL